MSKRALWAICGVFIAFIALFFLLNIATPDRDFSEQENRSLQTKPIFSVESLFSGKYMSEFESYSSDQFVLRDQWISMKAALELGLGKKENNGVFLCDGQRLLEPYSAPTTATLNTNIQAINTLTDTVDAEVILGLIPGSAEIYREMLPLGVKNDSQLNVINYVYGKVTANTLDIASLLKEHSSEDIFYRTDHHWTTLGAYYGYTALANHLGISFVGPDEYTTRRTVTEEFYGTTYSASGFSWVKPDRMEVFADATDGLVVRRYEGTEGTEIPLYDESKLLQKDKYSYYLGGNTPRLVIETGIENKPTLLILRDSYCDSLTPFLLKDYSAIHILDLRYYRNSIVSYAEECHADQILVLYSVPNFSTDRNILLLAR